MQWTQWILLDLDGNMSAGVTVSNPYMEILSYMEGMHFCPPQMVCLITHHIPELLFFQAWNGSTFDSIAVYSTWCSVIPKTWTADVIFPRNALPIELGKRKRLGFSRVIDCMQSFAEVWTVGEKNTGENTQLMWCKSSSFNGIVVSPCVWWKFLLMTFEFTFHYPILLTTIKKGSFCCCETWTTVPAANPKRWVLSFLWNCIERAVLMNTDWVHREVM